MRSSNVFPQSIIWAKVRNISKISTEIFQFLQLKKNLYITWACFRNVNMFFFFIPCISDFTFHYDICSKMLCNTGMMFVFDTTMKIDMTTMTNAHCSGCKDGVIKETKHRSCGLCPLHYESGPRSRQYEPHREKPGFFPMQKQRRRSSVQ